MIDQQRRMLWSKLDIIELPKEIKEVIIEILSPNQTMIIGECKGNLTDIWTSWVLYYIHMLVLVSIE